MGKKAITSHWGVLYTFLRLCTPHAVKGATSIPNQKFSQAVYNKLYKLKTHLQHSSIHLQYTNKPSTTFYLSSLPLHPPPLQLSNNHNTKLFTHCKIIIYLPINIQKYQSKMTIQYKHSSQSNHENHSMPLPYLSASPPYLPIK